MAQPLDQTPLADDNPAPDSKQTKVLEAALVAFSRYGFRRTSMADIAKGAGISRPALYLLFCDKKDIFRSLARQLLERTLQAAEAALAGGGTIRERLTAAFAAKNLEMYRLIHGSPHGAELLDVNAEIAGDITRPAEERFQAMLTAAIAAAATKGELDLARARVSAAELAETMIAGALGFKANAGPIEQYKERLATVVRLGVAAAGG